MWELNISSLKKLLGGKLPGKEAQYKMAPESRKHIPENRDCKEAAILLLIYSENDDLRIAFIKRNEYEGHHSGQISFPGGMKETKDLDFLDTALRETAEEIGIPSEEIEILGKLTSLHIPVSNFCVHPFVGWMKTQPEFKIDRVEVQYLVCPKLDDLLNHENIKYGDIIHNRSKLSGPYFYVENEIIWGATAMILSEFISLLDY